MSTSSIEWTDATWNPVVGCRRVSPGCEHCYAETMAGRLARMGQRRYLDVVKLDEKGQPRGRWNGTFREVPEALAAPLSWRKPRRIFVNSMSDLFGEGVSDEWIDRILAVIALTPRHTYQVLTKRPERMARYFAAPGLYDRLLRSADEFRIIRPELTGIGISNPATLPMRWLWLGTSVENQEAADERIPHLLRVPAAVRFLSVEPLLGPVDLTYWLRSEARCVRCERDVGANGIKHDETHFDCGGEIEYPPDYPIDWVIVGGESGHGARPCDLAWIRSIVGQCRAAAVPVFLKQLGANPRPDTSDAHGADDARHLLAARSRKGGDWDEWPADLRVREFPAGVR